MLVEALREMDCIETSKICTEKGICPEAFIAFIEETGGLTAAIHVCVELQLVHDQGEFSQAFMEYCETIE